MEHKNEHLCKCLHNAEAVDLGPQLWAPPPHWAAPAILTFKFGRNKDRVLKWQRENKTPHLITCLRNTNSILISALDQGQQRSCSPEKTCKNRTAAHFYSRLASKRLLHSESSGLLPSSFSVKYFQRLLILKCLVHYLLSNTGLFTVIVSSSSTYLWAFTKCMLNKAAFTLNSRGSWDSPSILHISISLTLGAFSP